MPDTAEDEERPYSAQSRAIMLRFLRPVPGTMSCLTVIDIENAEIMDLSKNLLSAPWSLITITMPLSLRSIGEGCLEHCTNLVTVKMARCLFLQTISNRAFASTTGLKNVTLPRNLCIIGDMAFHASALQSIKLTHTNVRLVGSMAFYNCTDLQSVTFPRTLLTLDTLAFGNCAQLRSINMRMCTGMQKLGRMCFDRCKGLTFVALPPNIVKIPEFAFFNCFLLRTILVPKLTAHIGNRAFALSKTLCSKKALVLVCAGKQLPRIHPMALHNAGAIVVVGSGTPRVVHHRAIVGVCPQVATAVETLECGLLAARLSNVVHGNPVFSRLPVELWWYILSFNKMWPCQSKAQYYYPSLLNSSAFSVWKQHLSQAHIGSCTPLSPLLLFLEDYRRKGNIAELAYHIGKTAVWDGSKQIGSMTSTIRDVLDIYNYIDPQKMPDPLSFDRQLHTRIVGALQSVGRQLLERRAHTKTPPPCMGDGWNDLMRRAIAPKKNTELL